MNLIDATTQASISDALDSLFDTFKRPITIWSEAKKLIINTDPNFSRFSPSSSNNITVQNVPQSTGINAVIQYDNLQPYPFYIGSRGSEGEELKLRMPDGDIRIRVNISGKAAMDSAKDVQLDGYSFVMDSVPRPHGMFGAPNYFDYKLKQVK